NLAPGDTKRVAFTFDVEQHLADPEAKLELTISDQDLRETVAEKIRMPVAPPAPITAVNGTMRAKANGASLQQSPDPASLIFGKLPPGTAATMVGTSGDYVKLSL